MMKNKLKLIIPTLIVFVIITFVTAELNEVKGGSNQYGFPLRFTGDSVALDSSILNYLYLIIDILAAFLIVLSFRYFNKYIIKRVLRYKKKLTPKFWAYAYLSLIPTYAIIYFFLPNNFYDNSYNIEKLSHGFKRESNLQYVLIRDIVDVMANNFENVYHCNYLITNKGDTLFNPIGSYAAESPVWIEGSKLFIPVFVPIRNDKQKTQATILTVKMDLTNHQTGMNDLYTETRGLEIDSTHTRISDFDFDIRRLFPIDNAGDKITGWMSVPMSFKLQNEINAFAFGINSSSIDDFWNMFYLSAVTITTLGFGDIVPITTLARLVVASEAIIGIIIIGLFLNALSKEFVTRTRKVKGLQ